MRNYIIALVLGLLLLNYVASDSQVKVGVSLTYPLNEEVLPYLTNPDYYEFFENYNFKLLETENYYEEEIDIYQLQVILTDTTNFNGSILISTSEKMYLIGLPELRKKVQ